MLNDAFPLVAIMVTVIIVLFSFGIIISNVISNKRIKRVQETSVLLQNLLVLNSRYIFDWSIHQNYQYIKSLHQKSQFDRYDLNTLFDYYILNDSELMRAANVVKNNRNIYERYSAQVKQLKSTATKEITKSLHISYAKYFKIEQELFISQQVKPILECCITCLAIYSSPKGRNHYRKEAKYTIDEVPQRYKMLQDKIAHENSEEMRRKRTRSQMTAKLRYTILKRDGYKCQICGRTSKDGVKLHIDHIIPVSKGGETIPSNLRTLCDICNFGKGDEIE